MVRYGYPALIALVCGYGPFAPPAEGQTIRRERETTVTGPRGRTIDRRIEVDRGPGTYNRSLQIQRPGMTLERNVQVQGGRGGYVGGPRPATIIERNVFVAPRPASSWAFGFGIAPMVTIPFWQPAPPVVVAPAPVVMAPPAGGMVAAAPAMPAARPSPLDPVALAAQRLQSHHAGSRREGAETLGKLGDPRAVPALVNTLKYDSSKDVKIAAARSLGMLGGHEAEVVLERCIIYEKKPEVRDAAAVALRDLRDNAAARAASPAPLASRSPIGRAGSNGSVVPRLPATSPPPSPRSSPFRRSTPAPEPALDGPAAEESEPSPADRVPPPPPTPVVPQ